MRLTRLAVAAAAGLSLALFSAAPAAAQDFSGGITPEQFQAGDEVTLTTTACEAAPTVEDPNSLFAQAPELTQGEEGGWSGPATISSPLEPGTYEVTVTCEDPAGSFTVTTTVEQPPEPEPQFDADVNPKFFRAGDTLTFTAQNCDTTPELRDLDSLFVSTPAFQQVNDTTHRARATTRSNLVQGKTYRVQVVCGEDTITFTTTPGEPMQRDGDQTPVVPKGGVDTGDGSLAGGTAPVMPLLAGATALALGGAAIAFVARRRALVRENA